MTLEHGVPNGRRPSSGWGQYLAANAVRLAPAVLLGYAVLGLCLLLGAEPEEGDPAGVGAWLLVLFFVTIGWPTYIAALALVARRVRNPRRLALALTPLLGWPLNILLITPVPNIAGFWAFALCYGSIVRLPPGATPTATA